MSICPKGKVSKSRGRKRRAQSWKIPPISLTTCSNCGEYCLAHKVCLSCGYYKGQQVITKNLKKA